MSDGDSIDRVADQFAADQADFISSLADEPNGEHFIKWAILTAAFPDVARLLQLATMPYKEYLRTREWRIKRAVMLVLMDSECERCGAKEHLHLHHLTYARRGMEWMTDLEVLCASCHRNEHGIA